MVRRVAYPLVVFVLIVMSASKAYTQERADSALAGLLEHLDGIQSISGSFFQIAVDQKGATLQESKGLFKAKRPDFFYWRTEEPLEQEIYSDGKWVTVYDPDLEQATVQAAGETADNTPAVLFSGDTGKIENLYEVERYKTDERSTQYVLTPKSEESLFEKVLLSFHGAHIKELRLRDSLGQESAISFIQTEINPELNEADFAPQLPAGTDIIKDVPGAGPAS